MEAIIFYFVILFMLLIATVVVAIPVLTAHYSKRPIYLKIIFIIYLFLTIFIAGHIFFWVYMVTTMNSSAEIRLSNPPKNKVELNFIANQAGSYAIKLKMTDRNVLSEIEDCTFGKMSDSRNKKAMKYCQDNYGEKNILISTNGVTKPSSGLFGIIFFAGSDQTVLCSFDAYQHQSFQIKVAIDKKMQKLLSAGPSITIKPSGRDGAFLLYASICIYLPFILPAIIMLIYIRRKLKLSIDE